MQQPTVSSAKPTEQPSIGSSTSAASTAAAAKRKQIASAATTNQKTSQIDVIQEEAAEVAMTNNVESSKSRSGETDDNINNGSKASTIMPVAATEKPIKIIKRPSTNTRVTTADQLSAQGAKRESVLAAVPEKPITDEQLIEFE